jgi:uncharacterized membrane protein
MLLRQEIAFLFYSLALLALFTLSDDNRLRAVLIFCFSIGVVLAHYSTGYIFLGMIIGSFVLYKVLGYLRKRRVFYQLFQRTNLVEDGFPLTASLIIAITLVAALWYGPVAHIERGLTDTITTSTRSLDKVFSSEMKSNDVVNIVLGPGYREPLDNQKTIEQELEAYGIRNAAQQAREVPLSFTNNRATELTAIGKILSSQIGNMHSAINLLKNIFTKAIQLGILFGFGALLLWPRFRQNISTGYLIMAALAITGMGLMIALPFLSVSYGILRLFQQLLLIMGVVAIIGMIAPPALFRKDFIWIPAIVIIGFFLLFSGFIPALTGGIPGQYNLDNSGQYYEVYYTHAEDVLAAQWIGREKTTSSKVFTDTTGLSKIRAYGDIQAATLVHPTMITAEDYVYATYTNTVFSRAYVANSINTVQYVYPHRYLEERKNIVYSNTGARIYQ